MKPTGIEELKRAIPYVQLYRDRTFVVKLGGSAVADVDSASRIMSQVATLHGLGIRVVVVHGGADQTNALLHRLGETPVIVDGRRITDQAALDAAVMAILGTARTTILAACRSLGLPAVGISGIDAGCVRASRRPPVPGPDGQAIDYGLVGDVVGVQPGPISTLLSAGIVPVLSPLCADDSGQVLNINADTVAAEVAVGLGAAKLVMVTGAPGILQDPTDLGSLLTFTDLASLDQLEAADGIGGGMKPKVAAIRRALGGGVERAHVIGHAVPDSLLVEILTNQGSGTLVVADAGAEGTL